jgi:hypothetical protein
MTNREPIDDDLLQPSMAATPAMQASGAHHPWFLAVVLVIVTFVAYQPTWHAGFIGWDDYTYVAEQGTLRSLDGLGRIWAKPGSTPQYYPLVFTTFWVEYHFWRLQPFGYHLVNILLHGLNAVLLWLVLRKLKIPGAWWAAAIFALHPCAWSRWHGLRNLRMSFPDFSTC